jgi:predicted ATPase
LLWAVPITELRIEGLRTIEKLRLTLDGLTVLIGDNGTGKSSILEACEILRRATGPRFMDELHGIHGGLTSLLRQGAQRLVIGVTVRPDPAEIDETIFATIPAEHLEYDLVLSQSGAFASFEEVVRAKPSNGGRHPRSNGGRRTLQPRPRERTTLTGGLTEIFRETGGPQGDQRLTFLASIDPLMSHPGGGPLGPQALPWCTVYLKALQVNLPFEVTPAWAARALDRKSALRSSALLTPADHLEKLGLNLASSYHALKNNFGRAHWEKTVDYLRLGLGERIEDVVTWADPGGGNIGLSLKLVGLDRPVPSSQLSDGMLSYLAFVALFRLHTTKPSLVAFDEPDLHLHPHLLMRVLDMFDAMARDCPVLLATHSDRLLDGLTDPAKSVVLCELDERGATRLVRPDREALAKWLTRYRGLGDIRSAGHAASVLTRVEPT